MLQQVMIKHRIAMVLYANPSLKEIMLACYRKKIEIGKEVALRFISIPVIKVTIDQYGAQIVYEMTEAVFEEMDNE